MLVQPMLSLFDDHLFDLGYAPLTRDGYLRQVRAVFELVGIRKAADFTKSKLQAAVKTLRRRVKPRTLRGYASALVAFGGFLIEEELVEYNAAKLLLLPRCKEPDESDYFSEAEALALCAAPLEGEITPKRIHDAAIMHLLYDAALRRCEVGTIRRVRYNQPKDGYALVSFIGKGDKARSVSVKTAGEVLRDYARVRRFLPHADKTQALFPGRKGRPLTGNQVYYIVRTWARRVGIDRPAHPHMFRHSHATHLLLHWVPLPVVQKRLGHLQLSTTSRYAHAGLLEQAEALEHLPLNRR